MKVRKKIVWLLFYWILTLIVFGLVFGGIAMVVVTFLKNPHPSPDDETFGELIPYIIMFITGSILADIVIKLGSKRCHRCGNHLRGGDCSYQAKSRGSAGRRIKYSYTVTVRCPYCSKVNKRTKSFSLSSDYNPEEYIENYCSKYFGD